MMNLTDNISFISVESRKGGVGKSTVSLILAQLLLSKGYQVLLIDLDVYGTRVSPEFINKHKDFLHTVTLQGQDANIIQLYSDSFQGESQNKSFSFTNDHHQLFLMRDRCNYLCSDLYGSQDNVPIEDPRILNDMLHAYWMREQIESLSSSFSRCLSVGEHGVIILDNAPGFSSLETSVHELLTTIGPRRGKFILVSSLDDQDLNATHRSLSIIRNLLEDKISGAKYYHSLKSGDNSLFIDKPAFNEIWKELCATDGKSPQYFASVDSDTPSDYFISVLVNKGPKRIMPVTRDTLLKSFGHYYAYCPFLESLRFYFAAVDTEESDNPMRDIQHLKLSCIFSNILEDSKRFQEYLKNEANDRAVLIQPEWDPLFCFRQIFLFYQTEDGVTGSIESAMEECLRTFSAQSSAIDRPEFFEIDAVCSFMNSISPKGYNKDICNEIVALLKESKGQEFISWQTDNIGLRHYGKLIELGGKAFLWIQLYPKLCEMLNIMMTYQEQTRFMETRDILSISSAFSDLLNGSRILNDSFQKEWDNLLTVEINAFEMRRALKEILSEMAL